MTDQPDIEAIGARHRPQELGTRTQCFSDGITWSCDTAIVIERLRAVEAERDRWREDAERLADALRRMVDGTDQVVELLDKYRNIPGNDSTVALRSYADTARDDLAAHDAMTREP